MAATKRQMNWSTVSHSTGTPTTATGVTQVQIDHGLSVQKFSGDADGFPTCVVRDFRDPSITVTTADQAWADAAAVAASGTVVATHKDAKAAVNGSITYTLSNAIAEQASDQGSHRAFGSAQIKFTAQSTDGTTSPLAISMT